MGELFEYNGRRYRVMAKFTSVDREREANVYMRTHVHASVLCDKDGAVVIVSDQDRGVPVEDDDMEKGWRSLFHTGAVKKK